MAHKFDPRHTEVLLSLEREREISPEEMLKAEGLREGSTFADIGCGPGFFTIPACRIVGQKGRVWAVDTQEEMLELLKKRNPPGNCSVLRSGETSIPVNDGAADFALLAYVLHEAEDKTAFLTEVKRIIKTGGKLILLEWKKKREEEGPPIWERVPLKTVRELLKGVGFKGIRSSSLNPSHYKVVAFK